MKKSIFIFALILAFISKMDAQNYYGGKVLFKSSSYHKAPEKLKQKIYIQQVIDSSFIRIDIIIKEGRKKTKISREYKRYVLGKHYPDFRLFIKKRNNDQVRYIKPGDNYEIDLYDGILRSLLPDFEFFHEKTHRIFFNNSLDERYNIAFDIIKEKDETIFNHKFQFEKSVAMNHLYYSASGISNDQKKIELIKIETINWKGPSSKPFLKENRWIELSKARKKRKLRQIKKLFRKTK